MLGAIIGDIVGAPYEFNNLRSKNFELFTNRNFFTDDTVLTIATAEALMGNRDFAGVYKKYGRQYPNAGWGSRFSIWLQDDSIEPYGSMGNGSAMRVSAVAYVAQTVDEAMSLAKESAIVTHNHFEGVRGAEAVAKAIYLARKGNGVELVVESAAQHFGCVIPNWNDLVRYGHPFSETCRTTVPVVLACVLNSTSFEDCLRNAVLIGGDTDTIACIAGSIAEPLHGIPDEISVRALSYLDERLLSVFVRFNDLYKSSLPKF